MCLGHAVDMDSRRRKHKKQTQTEHSPSCFFSGSVKGAVFMRGLAATVKELSKEFIQETVL